MVLEALDGESASPEGGGLHLGEFLGQRTRLVGAVDSE